MLNSQLYMPENEHIKERLIENMMAFSPGLGDLQSNYQMFKIQAKRAMESGLFTTSELIKLHDFWSRYGAQQWLDSHIMTREDIARNYLQKPWYKRIFSKI